MGAEKVDAMRMRVLVDRRRRVDRIARANLKD